MQESDLCRSKYDFCTTSVQNLHQVVLCLRLARWDTKRYSIYEDLSCNPGLLDIRQCVRDRSERSMAESVRPPN